ncbi:MAG: Ig-like domain-containing protein [Candidatus Saccharimonadales bacterium]
MGASSIKDNVIVGAGKTTTGYGISITGSGTPLIAGNLVGVTPAGVAAGNRTGGVNIASTTGAVIGGQTTAERNVISGNNTLTTTPGVTVGASNTNVKIEGNYIGVGLDGVSKLANGNGINITGAGSTNVAVGGALAMQRNIISGNTTNGINVQNTTAASNIAIKGNYIGLDKNGDPISGASASGTGIYASSPKGVQIGGASAGEGNVISGNNSNGMQLTASSSGANVTVYGNIVGLKPDGVTAAPNAIGIYITNQGSPTGSYHVGGASAGQGNLVSGNATYGIRIGASVGSTAYPIYIQGNKVGTAADGVTAVPNYRGISIANGSQYVIVGGIGAGEGNIVRSNTYTGVEVTDTSTNYATIRGNAISSNGGLGIDIVGTLGVPDTWDLDDSDSGPNGQQNFPRRTTITKCDGSSETRTVLRSAANTTYDIDFYANPAGRDASGYGEGEQYLSSTTVTTNSNGYAEVTPPAAINLSMTATAPDGSTSEFSNERAVSVSSCDVTPLTTKDTTPPLAGTVTTSSFSTGYEPSTKITVDTQTVTGTTTSPTWTLADNTLAALSTGTYDVTATFTDQETTMTASKTLANALTIDTSAPTGTVNPLPTGISNSPELSGTVSDAAAIITVTVEGTSYSASNTGNGEWALSAGTINPGLAPGTYTATVTFRDAADNTATASTTFTIERSDADLPTVNPLSQISGKPIITGTYDSDNSQSLRVTIGGRTYVLGVDSELTVDGNDWRLDLSQLSLPLTPGSYNVAVAVTTRSGHVLGDASTNEITILAPTLSNKLAETGEKIWPYLVAGLATATAAVAVRRTKNQKI